MSQQLFQSFGGESFRSVPVVRCDDVTMRIAVGVLADPLNWRARIRAYWHGLLRHVK